MSKGVRTRISEQCATINDGLRQSGMFRRQVVTASRQVVAARGVLRQFAVEVARLVGGSAGKMLVVEHKGLSAVARGFTGFRA